MIDLHDLLDRRASMVQPPQDAFERVIGAVRRRHARRKAAAWGSALCLLAAGLMTIAVAGPMSAPSPAVTVAAELMGTTQALAVRSELGIEGPTKGAPDSILVAERTLRPGQSKLSLVHVRTGKAIRVQVDSDAGQAAVSPRGDAVAAVSHHSVVVASAKRSARPALITETNGVDGQVSWDGTGSALFTRVRGQWVRVSHPIDGESSPGRPVVQRLTVPSIPGGPILLSVSPGGAVAVLFGITYPEGATPVPHLFVARFDGVAVSDPREIDIPTGALEGPMGWVGENAFLLAPGPGRALVVRTDGSKLDVIPREIADPCATASSTEVHCLSDGPWLLGTNADGSLLFWRITVERWQDRSEPPPLVLYYKTWLDGSHGRRLEGLIGRFGPPVAPR